MKNQFVILLKFTIFNGPNHFVPSLYWSSVLSCFTFGALRDTIPRDQLAEEVNRADNFARRACEGHGFSLFYMDLDPEARAQVFPASKIQAWNPAGAP